MEDNIDTEQEDPYVNCEKNLLHHIIKVQSTLDERLDMIEEQVAGICNNNIFRYIKEVDLR